MSTKSDDTIGMALVVCGGLVILATWWVMSTFEVPWSPWKRCIEWSYGRY
jgi:hypothetical protein